MDKYIKVDWPDSQKFINYNECYYGLPKEEDNTYYCYFVSEDLYNEVMNNPKVYESVNLGTITFYKNYTFADNHCFWHDRNPQKNDKLLIYNKNTEDYKIVTCIASQEGFPILTDDKGVTIGIFDELIGSYDPEIPF